MTRSQLLQSALRHFRSRRMRLFEQTFHVTRETRILDVGGSPEIWRFASVPPNVTILNLPSALLPQSTHFSQVAADGLLLPFRDQSFDIVFSNSVIEHVGSRANQERFAAEIGRVGKAYWVQTPNKRFPVEMHLMLPGIHLMPKRVQRFIIQRFTGWEFLTKPTLAEKAFYLEHFLHELALLDGRAIAECFPDATILRERSCGLTKSLIALRM